MSKPWQATSLRTCPIFASCAGRAWPGWVFRHLLRRRAASAALHQSLTDSTEKRGALLGVVTFGGGGPSRFHGQILPRKGGGLHARKAWGNSISRRKIFLLARIHALRRLLHQDRHTAGGVVHQLRDSVRSGVRYQQDDIGRMDLAAGDPLSLMPNR